MPSGTNAAALMALCGLVIPLTACTSDRPPQTAFYCLDLPEGRSGEASRFVRDVADRLDLKVSEAQFPTEKGPPDQAWELHGRGVSMFLGTAMKSGKPDRYGNRETTFNPHRLGFNVVKTGWRQEIGFDDVVAVARTSANQLGWRFSKAGAGNSCST
jgi:hypothetical protein